MAKHREEQRRTRASNDGLTDTVRHLAPSVLDGAPAFIGICDRSFKPIYLNPAGHALVRFPANRSVANTTVSDFFVPDQRNLISEVGLPTMTREGQWEQDVSFRNWSDPKHDLNVHCFAFGLYDDSNAFLAGVTITREIATHTKVAGTVREAQAMVTELIGMLPLGVGIFDAAGRLLHSNGSWRRLRVASLPERPAGRRERWKPTQESVADSPHGSGLRALTGEPVPAHPSLLTGACTDSKWIRVSAWPLTTQRDSERRAAVIVEDIDKLERTKTALLHSEARLRLAAEVTGLGTFSFDPALAVFTWDERHRRMWGVTGRKASDWQTFQNGIHPEDGQRVRAAIGSCFSAGQPKLLSLRYRVVGRDDGRVRHISSTLMTTFEDGRMRALIGASVGLSAEKRGNERVS